MKFCGILGKEDDERKMEMCYHKVRKQQIRKLVGGHKDLAVAHANYIESLRSVGCAIHHFASYGDSHLRSQSGPNFAVQPSPDTSTSPPSVESWDFWMPAAKTSTSGQPLSGNNSSSGMKKMVTNIQKCFSRAADSGKDLPVFLGRPSSMWLNKKKFNHSTTTAEKLYDLEKKLYQQVKLLGKKKINDIEKRKTNNNIVEETGEKIEKSVEEDIEATSSEINKLSDRNLYGDVVKHVEGLMFMWTTMYECHHEQAQILLNYIPCTTSSATTIPVHVLHLGTDVKFEWEIKKELTLQLERDVKQWMNCFCNLMACQRLYITSLNGWLRLIKLSKKKDKIYSLCQDWSRVVDKIPDKVAKDGIKHLLKTVRDIKVQERKVHKYDKMCKSMCKKIEKERFDLICMECKLKGLLQEEPSSSSSSNIINASSSDVAAVVETVFSAVEEKRAKVAALMAKAEEVHQKSINLTRTTHNNLVQWGLPHAIEALAEFARKCKDAFHSIYASQNLPNTS